ncbi:MAG: hypothetical protein J0L64_00100 [Acidobacteria bacterium]|jgi:hypothetical protein|nr:hypothetical protein [Acidobacteriota bacterium]
MLDWQHLTKLLAVSLALILAMAIVAPQPAHAQFSLGGITGAFNLVNQVANNILSFINNTMRPLLEGVQSAAQALQGFLNQLRNLWEQVVWPLSEINRARNLASNLIATFRGLLNNLYAIGVNSAQLPNPSRLEAVMRNRQVGDHPQLVSEFQRTFGTLPAPSEVHPEERNLIDVDDALAISQLMTLKMGDASADNTLRAAEAIEEEATRMAPGSAAMSAAAAYIAAVQSQAHIQKMLAGQLRQEAARLAHDTMTLKRGANFTRESRTKASELNK